MKITVIGGGAAGMLAAYYSAKNGNEVTLIEKNEKLGKKLYITGKGRCNVTNDCDEREFLSNVVRNSKFMTGCIYRFPPKKTIEFLEENGLTTKVERGNRVFPLSDKSSDVISCFKNALIRENVIIKLSEKVLDITCENGTIKSVITDKNEYFCDKIIVCTGGFSYPATGSTGDGYKFASKLGHKVISTFPSLTGINLYGEEYKFLQGLTLKNVAIYLKRGEKILYNDFGEMLFTHFGISGPVVLSSSAILSGENCNEVTFTIDLKPALSLKQLDERILRDFDKYKNKALKNSLDDLLLKSLIPLIIKRCGIDENKKNNVITCKEREILGYTIKNLCFSVKSLRDFNEAIITRGGIDVKEINPKTMESKLIKGLFFAGEVLDIDAFTGGFNLQIAFSTAYAASN